MAATGAFDGAYAQPFERDYARFGRAITEAAADGLLQDGYCVLDGFFGAGWARALLQEQRWLAENGHFEPNRTQFSTAAGESMQFSKPNIYERDLHDEGARGRVRELAALWEQDELVDALNDKAPGLMLARGTGARTLKLQWNRGGGGCFPVHYDNPGRPNRRRITCLAYLNEDWEEGHGGELMLYPFCRRWVKIPPLMDRVVLFQSDRVLHRVLPAAQERFCFTIWLDGGGVNSDDDVTLRLGGAALQDLRGTARALAASPAQRSLSRAVYEEEYEESLRECMEGAEGHGEMLASHRAFLAGVKKNGPLAKLVGGYIDPKP